MVHSDGLMYGPQEPEQVTVGQQFVRPVYPVTDLFEIWGEADLLMREGQQGHSPAPNCRVDAEFRSLQVLLHEHPVPVAGDGRMERRGRVGVSGIELLRSVRPNDPFAGAQGSWFQYDRVPNRNRNRSRLRQR
jgi:hypothetical protein